MRPPAINYQWSAVDGTPVTIRPIQPEDREIELAFVQGLSSGSSYMRFFVVSAYPDDPQLVLVARDL